MGKGPGEEGRFWVRNKVKENQKLEKVEKTKQVNNNVNKIIFKECLSPSGGKR